MNCPNCGQTAPSAATRCGHCNFKLPATEQPQAAQSGTTLPCWNCRHPNPEEAERCEHCNAKMLTRTAPFASRPSASAKPGKPQYSNAINHVE
jgi:hypothetical protein